MSCSGVCQNSVGDSVVLSIEEFVLDRVEPVDSQRRTGRVGRQRGLDGQPRDGVAVLKLKTEGKPPRIEKDPSLNIVAYHAPRYHFGSQDARNMQRRASNQTVAIPGKLLLLSSNGTKVCWKYENRVLNQDRLRLHECCNKIFLFLFLFGALPFATDLANYPSPKRRDKT